MRMRAKVMRPTPDAIQQVEAGEGLALKRIPEPAGRRAEQTRGVIARVADAVERGKLRSAFARWRAQSSGRSGSGSAAQWIHGQGQRGGVTISPFAPESVQTKTHTPTSTTGAGDA